MTGLEPRSLVAADYGRHISAVGLSVASECKDLPIPTFHAFKDAQYLAYPSRRNPGSDPF
jgi:hypothetical protein